jgi:hypothetical protein
VSTISILLVAEGPHELGRSGEEFAPADAPPPLAILVRRLTNAAGNVRFLCRQSKSVLNMHRGKMMSRMGKKVYSAMWFARHGHSEKMDAVVFLSDRDGPTNKSRLREMREGRDDPGATPVPCAVGVAVETFDAWMIAEAGGIRAAGGDPAKAQPAPEKTKNPKDVADAIFGTEGGTGLGAKYAIIAENVDLELLAQACPEGFAPFAEEVRQRIGHAVAGS